MIQILELFGGIGSPRCALRNIGIPVKAIDYVEIDEKAVRSYNAMFADGCVEPIAEYESKERCLEVLDELQEVCGKYLMVQGGTALIRGGMNVQPGAFEIPRVYEMPEK